MERLNTLINNAKALSFVGACAAAMPAWGQLVINEVDSEMAGIDSREFVELYGPANLPLNGISLVFINGLNDAVYQSFSLDGFSLDANGFFLAGGPGLPNANLTLPESFMQPGPDAVAIYDQSVEAFPVGAAATNEDLLDAVVYGNSSPTDFALIDLLVPGQTQLNENSNGAASYQSSARLPDGGAPLTSSAFVQQTPSPGSSNALACDGGTLSLANPANAEVCSDQGVNQVNFTHSTDAVSASVSLVLSDPETGTVLSVFPGTVGNFEGFGDAVIDVWAVSHDAPLDPATTAPGQPLSGLTNGGGCISFSYAPVTVTTVTCEAPSCDGGVVTDAGGTPSALGCAGFENAIIPFGYTSEAFEATYLFCITDESGAILDTVSYPLYDFSALGAGIYEVWGVSVLDGFIASTLAVGEPVTGVVGVACDSLSSSPLVVEILNCESGSFCEELFISEYVEGNSNNKAIEIYNPAPLEIDLSEYSVETWNNGATAPTNQQDLSGTLMPGDVFVLMNANATPDLAAEGDLVSQATWFNGNDVIRLLHGDVVVDQMGEIGPDSGEAFEVAGGTGAMAEYTLVRKANVSQGTTDWALGSEQWDVYPQDTFDFIGEHSATCGGTPPMQVSFAAGELYVAEGAGVSVVMQVGYPLQAANVQIQVVGGDAVAGEDYPGIYPLDFTFETGLLNDLSFTFAPINDEDPEPQEDVILELTVLQDDVEVLIGQLVIHILPSDLTYPVYDIVQVRSNDVNGVADSLDVACELRGIVHGWNDYPSAFQFTLIDETGGINVFSPVSDFGYAQVIPGDSVRIRGYIDQYAGLTQIIADTLIFEGSGFITQEPYLVNELDEDTESEVVKLKCVELVDAAQWTNSVPSFEVDITTGANVYRMRVDANTDLFGMPAPVGTFGVTGIADQRDFDAPFTSGYRISPRNQFDLSDPVVADFSVTSPWSLTDGPLELENLSSGGGSYFWTFGNGDNSQDALPEYSYLDPGVYTVTLNVTSEDGNCSAQATNLVSIIVVGVGESYATLDARLWPNPVQAGEGAALEAPKALRWTIVNARGQQVLAGVMSASTTRLPIEGLAPGMYVVQLDAGSGSAPSVVRLVVQ
jgi:PKD repeat protein